MFPQANPASGGFERQLPDIMLPCQENAAALVCSSAVCWMCCMLEDAIGMRQTVQHASTSLSKLQAARGCQSTQGNKPAQSISVMPGSDHSQLRLAAQSSQAVSSSD